jgi:deoxyribodipyrimidine photo-lyase
MRRLLWFRRDLRTQDNPLLAFDGEVLPIFIFDTNILDKLASDDRRVGIIHSMVSELQTELRSLGLDLFIFHGDPVKIIAALQRRFGFDEVCASADFDAYAVERDRQISHLLPFHTLHDTYITRPDEMLKNDGTPFLVFSPFYKALKVRFTSGHIREFTVGASSLLPMEPTPVPPMDCLGFTPSAYILVSPKELLARFAPKLANYKEQRDRLDIEGASRLDVSLRFGTISVREILRWLAARKKEGIDTEPFFRQLVFRDFYAHMLCHFPSLEHRNYRYTWGGIGDLE